MASQAFYLSSHNLTRILGLTNRVTGVAMAAEQIETITGKLMNGETQVGADIAFTPAATAGDWNGVWLREMVLNDEYELHLTIIGSGLQQLRIIKQPARYLGAASEC